MLLCGWHIQRNFISKFSGMSKRNKKIYDMVLNLPFISCEKKFEEILEEIFASEDLTETEINYLNVKLQAKERWAKCRTKLSFCGGVCTTSRIEGLHAILKRHLNSNSSLQKLFNCFRQIEETQLEKFTEEYNRHAKKSAEIDAVPLKEIKKKFSEYIYKKLAPKFSKALNYILEKDRKFNTW